MRKMIDVRPARQTRNLPDGAFETAAFAKRRDKRRRQRDLAKTARRKGRK